MAHTRICMDVYTHLHAGVMELTISKIIFHFLDNRTTLKKNNKQGYISQKAIFLSRHMFMPVYKIDMH